MKKGNPKSYTAYPNGISSLYLMDISIIFPQSFKQGLKKRNPSYPCRCLLVSLKYAIPAMLIIIAVAIWNQSDNQSVTEQLLAEISTEEILIICKIVR